MRDDDDCALMPMPGGGRGRTPDCSKWNDRIEYIGERSLDDVKETLVAQLERRPATTTVRVAMDRASAAVFRATTARPAADDSAAATPTQAPAATETCDRVRADGNLIIT